MKHSCGYEDDGIGHNCCKIVDEVKKRIEDCEKGQKKIEEHGGSLINHQGLVKLKIELQKIMDDKDDR